MRPLSAADAITPAIQRMRNLLFRPFVFTTFLKLSFVAVLTEGFSGNFNFSTPSRSTTDHSIPSPDAFAWTPGWIVFLIVLAVALVVLSVAIFCFIVRLRFALFHCLVHGTTELRPGWRQYRAQAGRFFWLCIVVGIVFFAIAAVIAVPFVFGFIHLFQVSQNNHLDVPAFLTVFLPLLPVIFVFVCAAIATDIILRDLMLPHMASKTLQPAQRGRRFVPPSNTKKALSSSMRFCGLWYPAPL
jgi:hypothetical protein